MEPNALEITGVLAQTSPNPLGLRIKHAEGCYLIDADGKRYLDLVAGLAVNNIGYGNREVLDAIIAQAENYLHVIPYGEFTLQPQELFARMLTDLLPDSLEQVYFVNSGTEAVEGALKLAKRITGRTQLVGFDRSYHGSTHGSLSVTGNETKRFRNRPLLPDTMSIPFDSFDHLELITERTAAVIVEPVQGDAGVRIPASDWMLRLRERTEAVGAMLIFDEVQTGFGRTGKLFAFEHFGVVPDILVLGKALGGGMPMGAFISSADKMEMLSKDPVLGHITTFGGHPISCVAGSTALKVLTTNRLWERSGKISDLFKDRLKHDRIKEFRGIGAMMAVDLDSAEMVRDVVLGALDEGVLGFWFLSCPTAFRLAPPLTISNEEIDIACSTILKQLDRI
jgi:acetylornithine/succinyldiaminopimelate/putrescine aminotransferase